MVPTKTKKKHAGLGARQLSAHHCPDDIVSPACRASAADVAADVAAGTEPRGCRAEGLPSRGVAEPRVANAADAVAV